MKKILLSILILFTFSDLFSQIVGSGEITWNGSECSCYGNANNSIHWKGPNLTSVTISYTISISNQCVILSTNLANYSFDNKIVTDGALNETYNLSMFTSISPRLKESSMRSSAHFYYKGILVGELENTSFNLNQTNKTIICGVVPPILGTGLGSEWQHKLYLDIKNGNIGNFDMRDMSAPANNNIADYTLIVNCPEIKLEASKYIVAKYNHKNAEILMKKGDELFAKGDFTGALNEYSNALKIDPNNASLNEKVKKADAKIKEKKKKEEDKKKEDEEKKKKEEEEKNKEGENKEKSKENDSTSTTEGGGGVGSDMQKQQEEYERLKRQNEWQRKNQEQMQQNSKVATELGAKAILVWYYIGNIIYGTLGNDNYENLYKCNNYYYNFNAGFTITSAPMFVASEREHYDGNNYTYDKKTINYDATSLNLHLGGEFWPVYSNNKGVGLFGNLGAGHGIVFENFHTFYEIGIKGFLGFNNIKLATEFSYGERNFSFSSWIDPVENGSGSSAYSFKRLKIGPRISWNSDKNNHNTTHLDIMPVFDMPDYKKTTNSYSPLVVKWLTGISINLWIENRFNAFFEYFWNYQRHGEVKYNNYDKDATSNGTFLRLGFIRTLDFFGESIYKHNFNDIKKSIEKENKFALSIINPSINWISSDNILYSNLNIGCTPILLEKDYTFYKQLSFSFGLDFSINKSRINKEIPIDNLNWNNFRLSEMSLGLPLAIRYTTDINNMQKYWVKVGLHNSFNFSNPSSFNIPECIFGIGIDFPTGPYNNLRVGLTYYKGISAIEYQNIKYWSNSLMVTTGFIF